MDFRDFITHVRFLTPLRVLIATFIAWAAGIPFAPLFNTIAPNVVTGGTMAEGQELLSCLTATLALLLSVLFLKGIIGNHSKKNGFRLGLLFGLFFGMLNMLSMSYMAHSYLYLFFMVIVPTVSFGFTGYYLGEKRRKE